MELKLINIYKWGMSKTLNTLYYKRQWIFLQKKKKIYPQSEGSKSRLYGSNFRPVELCCD